MDNIETKQRFIAGDSDAFNELWERHRFMLETFLHGQGVSAGDVKEVARRSHREFRTVYCFPSWLFSIATSLTVA